MTKMSGSDTFISDSSILKLLSFWQHQNRAKWDSLALFWPRPIKESKDGPARQLNGYLLPSLVTWVGHLGGTNPFKSSSDLHMQICMPCHAHGPGLTQLKTKGKRNSVITLLALGSQVLGSDGWYQETRELLWNHSVGEKTQPHTSLGMPSLFL